MPFARRTSSSTIHSGNPIAPSTSSRELRQWASGMNRERIRESILGGGFEPFALRTSNGREYAVRHPEMVLVAPRSLAVVERDGEIVTLDGLHVVAIKNLRAKGNRT